MISTAACGAHRAAPYFSPEADMNGGAGPLSRPLIYSAVVVKWHTRITWVVINGYKTATSSC